MSRQRRGVRRLQNQMPVAVDKFAFALRIRSPQDKNQVVALFGQFVNDSVGKSFPPFALMRGRPMGLDCEGGVQ